MLEYFACFYGSSTALLKEMQGGRDPLFQAFFSFCKNLYYSPIPMNPSVAITLLSEKDFDVVLRKHASATRKIASGNKLFGVSTDLGGWSASLNFNTGKKLMDTERVSLQNFLQNQQGVFNQVDEMYQRMEALEFPSLDIALTGSDMRFSLGKVSLSKEFAEISDALGSLVNMGISGRCLPGGLHFDFTEGLQDRNDSSPTNLPQVTTKEALTTYSEITFKLFPGEARDETWMFKGEVPEALKEYFSPPTGGSNSHTSVLTSQLYNCLDGSRDKISQGILTTDRWQAAENTRLERFVESVINSDACDADLSVSYNDENRTAIGIPPGIPRNTDILGANFNDLLVPDLTRRLELDGKQHISAPADNSSLITTIGVNANNRATYYATVAFEHSLLCNDMSTSHAVDVFTAISFGTIVCSDISTLGCELKALDQIEAQKHGLYNSFPRIPAAQSKYLHMLEQMDLEGVNFEHADGEIVDIDITKGATLMARQTMKLQASAPMSAKSHILMDSLIDMTTKYFRSPVLDSVLR